MSWIDTMEQALNEFFIAHMPSANTHRMTKALSNLMSTVKKMQTPTMKGTEMTTPTPDSSGYVKILQSDIDGWAQNVTTAVTALQAIVAAGNLPPADESAMNTVIGTLDGVAGTSTPPPPE